MKITSGVWAFLIVSLATSARAPEPTTKPFVPEAQGLTSQLCVERLEDSGAMNGQPNIVAVYDRSGDSEPDYAITLIGGGSSACVFLFPGRYKIVAISNRFEGPSGALPSLSSPCRSQPYKLDLDDGERVTLDVWPAIGKDGYGDCGWDLLPRGTPQPGNCEQLHNPPECSDEHSKRRVER